MLDFFQGQGAWLLPYLAKEVASQGAVSLEESMLVNLRTSLSECHKYARGKYRTLYSAKEKIKRNVHMLVFYFFSEWPLVLDHFLRLHAISKFLIKKKKKYLY